MRKAIGFICLTMMLMVGGAANADTYLRGAYPPVTPLKEHRQKAYQLAKTVQGTVIAVANTGSMEPVISAKDLLVMQPLDGKALGVKDIHIGDVIIFNAAISTTRYTRYQVESVQWLLCHRVIGKSGNLMRTKGDNEPLVDDFRVFHRQIKGIVLYAIDGQTGAVRDMRATREGELISFEQALRRHGFTAAAPELMVTSASTL